MSRAQDIAGNEKVFFSLLNHVQVVADNEGTLRVFRWSQVDESSELLKEYRFHEAPLVTVKFAPLQYKQYTLSVGLDFKIALHCLTEKHNEPVFEFAEESNDYGYCTAAEFLSSSKDNLRFIVATSAGFGFFFNSDKNFQEERFQLGFSSVRSLTAGPRDTLACVCLGDDPRLYFDIPTGEFVEFGSEVHDSRKVSLLAFQANCLSDEPLLLSAGEDLNLGLWKVDIDNKLIKLVSSFKLPSTPSAITWEVSGLSATIVCTSKIDGEDKINTLILKKDLTTSEENWNLKQTDYEKL